MPRLDALGPMMAEPREAWQGGPYARRAGELLQAHAAGLSVLVTAYAGLAERAAQRRDRMVITHGEPHAGNVMTTPGGLALVDWDTVLLAPPERDLWDMAGDDGSLLGHYTRATGIQIDPEALALYRLWFDLAEISEYLTLFRAPHGDTADAAEAWENLRHFLRPAERWPALCNPGRAAHEPEATT